MHANRHNRRQFVSALAGVGIVAATAEKVAGRPAAFRWPGGAPAAISLTYDDGEDSQLQYAVPALNARGLKATFFLTEVNMEARLSDWKKVARAGHEVANHTINHPCKLTGYAAADFRRREVDPMERFLNKNFGSDRPHTFAYPCGETGLGTGGPEIRRASYAAALNSIEAARTVEGHPNDPLSVVRNRLRLRAFEPTYHHDTSALAIRYAMSAINRGHWAILVFHRVLPRREGEGDTSTAVHDKILDWIVASESWCSPMGETFDYVSRSAPGRSVTLAEHDRPRQGPPPSTSR